MTDWSNSEKTLMIIGVLVIAVVLAGFAYLVFLEPMIDRAQQDMKQAAAEAKAKDDAQILSPSSSDIQKVAGKWGDAIAIGWTGKNTFVYEFKADGTFTTKHDIGISRSGKWGRQKGNNQLVYRYDGDPYIMNQNLRIDSSGQLYCDGFRMIRI